jgi:outer membrane protein assembly factor BamB
MGRMQFLAIEFKPDSHWTLGTNHTLHFTAAGNLELSNVATGEVVWQTNTRGQRMAMQADGNLVVYGHGQDVIWASDTAGNDGALLSAEDVGELMITTSDRGTVLWNARTSKPPVKEGASESKAEAPQDPTLLEEAHASSTSTDQSS